MTGDRPQHAAFQPERTGDRHPHRFGRPDDLPGIGLSEPVIWMFDLESILDRLAENAVFVAEPIPHRRDLQRGQL